MEYYFNYMGMLAEEGSYDSLDALVQSESLGQTQQRTASGLAPSMPHALTGLIGGGGAVPRWLVASCRVSRPCRPHAGSGGGTHTDCVGVGLQLGRG